jgi:hypothetical protein
MPRSTTRTAYCHQQAAECASAATTTAVAEIREAYLNMQQAWLQLAPDVESNQPSLSVAQSDVLPSKANNS